MGKMEGSSKMSSDDDDELWNTPSLISIVATLSRLKRKVLCNRLGEVSDKIRSNSAKLRKYTNGLFESAKQWGDKSLPGQDKLAFRSQKVLCNFTNPDSDSKDDGHSVTPPIIFGSSSGGKTAVRPSKLPAHPNVPPYTTWIYLDRNQRMTEDQSVQGRRRIYYDPVGNETLIASDSEEEEPEEEEPRHAFSKGEDYIIWSYRGGRLNEGQSYSGQDRTGQFSFCCTVRFVFEDLIYKLFCPNNSNMYRTAVQERGASGLLFEQIAQCIHVTREEVQARYELLLKDVDKQAKCEAHGEGTRTTVPSPGGRRKGTRDVGRLTYKETKSGPKEYLKTAGKGTTRKLEDEKVEPKDLVAAMDSFDNLFCRRCLVFDCRLHGCSQPLVHPSERQPPMNTDSEPTLPCGPHCYLLSQPARVGAPALCLPGVADSRAGDLVPPSGEGAEVARLAKRQKDGETSSGSEKLHPQFDRTSTLCVDASFVGKLENLSVNGKDKDITLGPIAETMHLRSSNEESPSLKREPPSIASRLTSHKKLARSTARRGIEQNGRRGGETQHRLKDVIDLTDLDMEFSTENGIGSPTRLAGEMTGNAMDGMTGSEQIQSKHDEELMLNQEKTRFSPTKKLGRSTKRALEENMQSPVKLEDQVELGSEIQDAPMVKRLALTTQNGRQEKVSSAVSSPPRSADGLKMNICQTGSDLFKEKGKGTSPKKLARSARKPIVGKLPGRVEGHELQSLGNLLEPSPEAEKPVKDESVRNSAARKLARSARKVFAEKVAVAIQQRQLQSHLDIVNKGRGEREHCKEESCDTGGTPTPPAAAIGNAIVPYARGEKSQAHLANPAKTYAVDSTQFTNKNGLILADDHEETKRDQTSARLTEVGAVMKTAVPKSEDAHKRAEFKDDWTPLEKGLYEKGMQIFGKSSCMIANNMLKGCKTCAEVRDYLLTQEAAAKRGVDGGLHQFPDSLACVLKWDVARARARFYGRRKGSRKLKFTLKSAGNAIRKRMVNGKDAPQRQYTPCGCLFTCGKQCPCQLSGTCCEKYCGCAKTCKNRFRGCHCAKSQCCSRQCPCFAASRECDPDVCRNCWTGCGDGKVSGPPPREDKDNYQCHNMKLLLKQQQRVLLSRSDVAGWGAFLKHTVSKHEYLGEYTGELISHREADKRGKIYDRENSSFLFNLNDQYVLDACRKGDKLKFANHSLNPNCYAKIMLVAGDHRVGIFANKMILAGEELFYDYRYEAERAPSWARRGDDSGNGKKDDTGPSERRSKQAS